MQRKNNPTPTPLKSLNKSCTPHQEIKIIVKNPLNFKNLMATPKIISINQFDPINNHVFETFILPIALWYLVLYYVVILFSMLFEILNIYMNSIVLYRPSLGSDEGISQGFDLYDTSFMVLPLRVEPTWLRSLGGPWFARPNF